MLDLWRSIPSPQQFIIVSAVLIGAPLFLGMGSASGWKAFYRGALLGLVIAALVWGRALYAFLVDGSIVVLSSMTGYVPKSAGEAYALLGANFAGPTVGLGIVSRIGYGLKRIFVKEKRPT